MTLIQNMARWRFRLKGRNDLPTDEPITIKPQEASFNARVTWPTVKRYLDRPDDISSLDMNSFPSYLIDGLGISPEELLNMKIGDLFFLEDISEEA